MFVYHHFKDWGSPQLNTTNVWEQHPMSHQKGATRLEPACKYIRQKGRV